MKYRVDNAVIMAAGTASRFAPLSFERPKALIEVKGEVLIERQIRQLQEAGISKIIIVVGYQKEQFFYLREKYGVEIVENLSYLTRNNNASIYAVREYLRNTYICSSDNYFAENPFTPEVESSYYAAVYAEGDTKEWCISEGTDGYIDKVQVGGRDSWIMMGHTFWDETFSKRFVEILEQVYDQKETENLLWESIYMRHLDVLKMKIQKYPADVIFEFDTLDELRQFDQTYICDTRSHILKNIAALTGCQERDITDVTAYKNADNAAAGIRFHIKGLPYEYGYETKEIRRLETWQKL